MIVIPRDIEIVEKAAATIDAEAEELQRSHTLQDDRDNWTGEEAAKAEYDELIKLASDLRIVAKRMSGQ